MTNIIHKAAAPVDKLQSCSLCQTKLPKPNGKKVPLWAEGDYIAVTEVFNKSEVISRIGYRIGVNNQDARCDGAAANTFKQNSI